VLHTTDTGAWERSPVSTSESLLAVRAVSPSEAWAVGDDGTVLHYAGGIWTPIASGATAILTGLAFSSFDDGWAIGSNGTLLHYEGGIWVRASQ
jgi:photosystem II stability/assembly factor-like uncharacterized protein